MCRLPKSVSFPGEEDLSVTHLISPQSSQETQEGEEGPENSESVNENEEPANETEEPDLFEILKNGDCSPEVANKQENDLGTEPISDNELDETIDFDEHEAPERFTPASPDKNAQLDNLDFLRDANDYQPVF